MQGAHGSPSTIMPKLMVKLRCIASCIASCIGSNNGHDAARKTRVAKSTWNQMVFRPTLEVFDPG